MKANMKNKLIPDSKISVFLVNDICFRPAPSIPNSPSLPASRSVRPYTSYGLESLRQQGRGWVYFVVILNIEKI